MRQVREVLRLKWEMGLTLRQIDSSLGISQDSVTHYVRRAEAAGLAWPFPAEWDDAALESRLFPGCQPKTQRPQVDFAWVHKELARKHVTLWLLWTEYQRQHSDEYQSSHFCDRYRRWAKTVDVTMRQNHRAGEKLFVDFAGDTVPVVDPSTGEVFAAHVFVAQLGASNYLYAEVFPGEGTCAWVMGVRHALEFFGGVPRVLIPDNPKAVVTRPCRYEPELNRVFQELASHYGMAVLPAPPRTPQGKAKVEAGVKFGEQRILAPLRDRTLLGLAKLNLALREGVQARNEEPLKKLEGNRRRFEELDLPALAPLPSAPYEFSVWKRARVHIDYPGEVKVLHQGKQVALHPQGGGRGQAFTLPGHLAPAHRKDLEGSPERFLSGAATIGPSTVEVIQRVLERPSYPEQGLCSCLGILKPAKPYEMTPLEAAARAASFDAISYRHGHSILEQGLDLVPWDWGRNCTLPRHANLRGAAYYGGREVY